MKPASLQKSPGAAIFGRRRDMRNIKTLKTSMERNLRLKNRILWYHRYQKKTRNDLTSTCACGHLQELSSHATFLWDTLAQSHIFAWISLIYLNWQTHLKGDGKIPQIELIPPHPPHPTSPLGSSQDLSLPNLLPASAEVSIGPVLCFCSTRNSASTVG